MHLKNRRHEDLDQLVTRALQLAAEGDTAKATELLASACARSRSAVWISTTLAKAADSLPLEGMIPIAAEAARRMKSPFLHGTLAALYQSTGRADLAATHYLKMGRVRGLVPEAQAGLAMSLFQSGKHDQAFIHAEKAYRMLPSADTAKLVARKRMAEQCADEVVSPIEEAMGDPETAGAAALSLACVEHLMDRSEEGLALLKRALELGAREEDVLPNYPELCLALGRVDEAEAALERASAMMEEEQVVAARAEIALARGDVARVETLLAELRRRWPKAGLDQVRHHCLEARLLAGRGRTAEAAAILHPYATVTGTLPRFSWMQRMMGEWTLRLGKTGEALDWFDRAAAKNPLDSAGALAAELRGQSAAPPDRAGLASTESPKEGELRALREEYEVQELEVRALRQRLAEAEARRREGSARGAGERLAAGVGVVSENQAPGGEVLRPA